MLNSRGFSLISLLISLGCGMALIAGLSTTVAGLRVSQQLMLDELMLQQELTRTTSLISNALQMSGQTGHVVNTLLSNNTLNHQFISALSLSAFPGEAAASCLLFAHDDNYNGVPDITPINEYKGLRLRDNALEVRSAGRSCVQGGWQDVTDPGFVSVDILQFAVAASDNGMLIHIELRISLAKNPDIYRQNRFTVRLQHG